METVKNNFEELINDEVLFNYNKEVYETVGYKVVLYYADNYPQQIKKGMECNRIVTSVRRSRKSIGECLSKLKYINNNTLETIHKKIGPRTEEEVNTLKRSIYKDFNFRMEHIEAMSDHYLVNYAKEFKQILYKECGSVREIEHKYTKLPIDLAQLDELLYHNVIKKIPTYAELYATYVEDGEEKSMLIECGFGSSAIF